MENYITHIDKQFESIILSDDRKLIDAFIIKYENILHSFKEKQVGLNKTETKLFYQDLREEYRLHFKHLENGHVKSYHSLFSKCIELITKLVDEAKEKQTELPPVPNNTHFECNCGSKVLITNKARHLKSPEHLNIKTNESTIKKEEYYNCICGSKVLITNKSRHLKSTKHNIKKEEEKKEEKEESKKEEKEEEKYYICNCGKCVLKSNKFNHTNTIYHVDWITQHIYDYTMT
jgi:DNA-directed RNA polymerase subunit RPC12/RpoP